MLNHYSIHCRVSHHYTTFILTLTLHLSQYPVTIGLRKKILRTLDWPATLGNLTRMWKTEMMGYFRTEQFKEHTMISTILWKVCLFRLRKRRVGLILGLKLRYPELFQLLSYRSSPVITPKTIFTALTVASSFFAPYSDPGSRREDERTFRIITHAYSVPNPNSSS
jgi:hypothetical protein